jgi:diguanylate cyclase (GGDEF)-like protein
VGGVTANGRSQQLRQKLLEIGQEILQQKDVGIILQQVAQAVKEHSPFQLVAISLFERALSPQGEGQERIAQMLTFGLDPEEEAKLQQIAAAGEFIPCRQILQKGKALGGGYYVTTEMIPEIVPKGVKGRVSRPGSWGAYDNLYFFLRQGQRIIGRISLADPVDGRVPSPEELEPLELFANLATLALEKAQYTEQLIRFQQRLTGIYRLSESLAQLNDLDSLAEQAVQIIREHFAYAHVSLFLKEGDELICRAFHTNLPREEIQFERFQRLRLDQGVCGWVARHKEPAFVGDVRTDARYISGHPAVRSELAVPILEDEELVGVLNIESLQEYAFLPEDLELLQALSRQLAVAMSNLRYREGLRKVMHEQEWSNRFLQEINRARGLQEAVTVIIQHGMDLLSPKANAGNFLLFNPTTAQFEFRAAVNRDLTQLQKLSLTQEEVLRIMGDTQHPLILTLRTQLSHPVLRSVQEHTGELPPASTIAVPIREEDQLIAVLNINHLTQEGVFTEEDVRKLQILIPEIELALSRARDHERFKELALRDSLTGTYNRHYFNEFIFQEQERAKRYSYPISLVMIDMDDFYEVNDRFGHAQGDRVLREIARVLLENVRIPDTVVRYGGDEFIIIMPQTTRRNAEEVMARLRRRLSKWDPQLNGRKISISFGVANWTPQGPKSLEQVLEEADEFMYRRRARARARKTRKKTLISTPKKSKSKKR